MSSHLQNDLYFIYTIDKELSKCWTICHYISGNFGLLANMRIYSSELDCTVYSVTFYLSALTCTSWHTCRRQF